MVYFHQIGNTFRSFALHQGMFLGWTLIISVLLQGPFQIVPAAHGGCLPTGYPPGYYLELIFWCKDFAEEENSPEATGSNQKPPESLLLKNTVSGGIWVDF